MKKVILLLAIVLYGCSDNVVSTNFNTSSTEVITLKSDSSTTIDGARTHLFGWDYIEIHSDIEVQLLANFEQIQMLVVDLTVSGVRWENMTFYNFRDETATIKITVKKHYD